MVSMAIASMWASMAAWFTPTVLFCAANLIIATIFIASTNTNNNHHSHEHHTPPTRISRVSSFLDRARSFKLPSYSAAESQYMYPSQSESESITATYSSTSRLAQSIHANPVPPEITHAHELLYPSEPETQALLSQPTHSPSFFQRVKSIKLTSDLPGQLGRPPSFLDRVRSFKLSFEPPETMNTDTDTDTDPGHNPEEHHVIRSKSEKTTVKKKKKLSGEMKKSRSEMRMAAKDDEEDGEDVDLRRPATARVRGSNDVDDEVDAKADDFISRFKQQLKLQRIESMVRYNQRLQNRSS